MVYGGETPVVRLPEQTGGQANRDLLGQETGINFCVILLSCRYLKERQPSPVSFHAYRGDGNQVGVF